jgi:hypothetical protein
VSQEATSLLIREQAVQTAIYEVVETVQPIADMIQLITTTRIEQIAIVTIVLRFEYEGKATSARVAQATRSTTYLLDNLRPLVRKTDVVFLLDHTFYFLLLGANEEGGSIVQTRLWDALLWCIHNIHDRGIGILHPRSMTIGHSAYPLPCREIDECLAAARETRQSFDTQPEKMPRKVIYRQPKPSSQPSHDEELPALAKKLGIPYLTLLPRRLSKQIQELVNPKLAQELGCYPLGRERGTLTVAMSNPQDRAVLDRLHQETGLHIFPVLAHPSELRSALEQLV